VKQFLTPSLLQTSVLYGVMLCCWESSQHFKRATVLQNIGNYLPNSRVTHSRRRICSNTAVRISSLIHSLLCMLLPPSESKLKLKMGQCGI